jgi:hypothetical protein
MSSTSTTNPNNEYGMLSIDPTDERTKTKKELDAYFEHVNTLPVNTKKLSSQSHQVLDDSSTTTDTETTPPSTQISTMNILLIVFLHIAVIALAFTQYTSIKQADTLATNVPTETHLPLQRSHSKKLFINITQPMLNATTSSGLLNWTVDGTYLQPTLKNSNFNLSVTIVIDDIPLQLIHGNSFLNQMPIGQVL